MTQRSGTVRHALGPDPRLFGLDLLGHVVRVAESMLCGQEDLNADVLDSLSGNLRTAARQVRIAEMEGRS